MNAPSSSRQQAIRSLIERFIAERLATKLESLSADDPKRATLLAQYAPRTYGWKMPLAAPGRSRR